MTERDRAVTGAEKDGGAEDDGNQFTAVNYILFAVGLLDIIAGWFFLRWGHITAAPIMLILGYCVIIPMAIIYRGKRRGDA